MIEYRKFITRKMLRDEPEALFVFGDNMDKAGLGGQAKEMRPEDGIGTGLAELETRAPKILNLINQFRKSLET